MQHSLPVVSMTACRYSAWGQTGHTLIMTDQLLDHSLWQSLGDSDFVGSLGMRLQQQQHQRAGKKAVSITDTI